MKIVFWKMHGAGNDFILIDDRNGTIQEPDAGWLKRLCERRRGVGSEGVILIQRSDSAHFRMRFFNPDGSEAEMCGNGARCVARLASDLGAAPQLMRFETPAGMIHAEIIGKDVRLTLPCPSEWKLNRELVLNDSRLIYHFVNTGVPHVVVETDSIESVKIDDLGPAIRYHADFKPRGTNVDFMQMMQPNSLKVRTYERGVEEETLACGTGITACALIAGKLGRVTLPVSVECAGGYRLEVNGKFSGVDAVDVTLKGPAEYVFKGEVDYSIG